jgi:selenide,water dikinase
LSAEALAHVLRPLQDIFPTEAYPDLLVGLNLPDDAAVWKLDGDKGMAVTTDFFTPVVDTPYEYGAIAAANALSDLYAMGARPIFALNVAAMPPQLPEEVVVEIMRGGAEKVREAGAVIAGGHSIQDEDPKYGLVAVGLVALDQMMTKTAARPGDLLLLTKPLGTGVTTTALKRGTADPQDVDQAILWMSRLNADAMAFANDMGVRAATDVTGFGFLGHTVEMAESSNVGVKLFFHQIPFLRGARNYAEAANFPGGSADNRLYFGEHVTFDATIDEYSQMMLFDAQTSGGLLLAVDPHVLDNMERTSSARDLWLVGRVVADGGVRVADQAMDFDLPWESPGRDLWFASSS